jgi:hypothetical protein
VWCSTELIVTLFLVQRLGSTLHRMAVRRLYQTILLIALIGLVFFATDGMLMAVCPSFITAITNLFTVCSLSYYMLHTFICHHYIIAIIHDHYQSLECIISAIEFESKLVHSLNLLFVSSFACPLFWWHPSFPFQ